MAAGAERSGKAGLSLIVKLGYGAGDLGGNLFFTLTGFYLLYYLTDRVGLHAGLAGTALMIGKVWDAATDPAVGWLSDRTRSRLGRRRPYILAGSLSLFVSMILLFLPPASGDQRVLFFWAGAVFCLACTAFTLVNIPYGALAPELTKDYHERTVLNGYRQLFALLGTFIGAGAVLPLAGGLGWPAMGAIMGGIMAISGLVTFLAVREPPPAAGVEARDGRNLAPPWMAKRQGLLASYLHALSQKAFLLVLIPWTLHITGITVIQGALLYYFKYIFRREEGFQVALMILLVAALAFIPIWVRFSRRYGKKAAYNTGMLFFAAIVLLFFAAAHRLGLAAAYLLMALAGIGFSAQYAIPYALIPDVVEVDAAATGLRREGVFYGIWTFASKVGQALAILASGWMLSLFGYLPHGEQTQEARLGIRLLCGPVPAAFFLAGAAVLCFYPITRDYYQKALNRAPKKNA